MSKEELSVAFEPGRAEILGCFKDYVDVKGILYSEEDYDDVILRISREEYIRVFNIWLDGKKEYCERKGYYCGVMGYISSLSAKKVGNQVLSEYTGDGETDTFIDKDYTIIEVSKFDDYCDFEHG